MSLQKVIYLSKQQYNILRTSGTITVGNVTYTYNQDDLYFVPAEEVVVDASPTSGSDNAVSSGGVYTALQSKQNSLTFDSEPTDSSSNPVTSGGVYSAINDNSLYYKIPLPRLKLYSGQYVINEALSEYNIWLPKNFNVSFNNYAGSVASMIIFNYLNMVAPLVESGGDIVAPDMTGTYYLYRREMFYNGSGDPEWGAFAKVSSSDSIGLACDSQFNQYCGDYEPIGYNANFQYAVYYSE